MKGMPQNHNYKHKVSIELVLELVLNDMPVVHHLKKKTVAIIQIEK